MDIDDFKSSFQSLCFNNEEFVDIEFTRKIEGIVEKVRKEDSRDRKLILGASIFLALMGVLYSYHCTSLYLENPHDSKWWGPAIYVLGILSAMPVLIYKYQKIGKSNYAAPVAQFIADVEKKFAFFPKDYALLLTPFFILIDISSILMFSEKAVPSLSDVLSAQVPILVGGCIGLLIGGIMWYKKKLPILIELRIINANLNK